MLAASPLVPTENMEEWDGTGRGIHHLVQVSYGQEYMFVGSTELWYMI